MCLVPVYKIVAKKTVAGEPDFERECFRNDCCDRVLGCIELLVAAWMLLVGALWLLGFVSDTDDEWYMAFQMKGYLLFVLKDFFVLQVLNTQLALVVGVFELVNGELIDF